MPSRRQKGPSGHPISQLFSFYPTSWTSVKSTDGTVGCSDRICLVRS